MYGPRSTHVRVAAPSRVLRTIRACRTLTVDVSRRRSNKGQALPVPIRCTGTLRLDPETPSRLRSPDIYPREGFWDSTFVKVGYIRTSKKDQNPELQRKDLLAAGCEKVFEEQIGGELRFLSPAAIGLLLTSHVKPRS